MILAQHAPGKITGIDFFPGFIERFNKNAEKLNLQNRVKGIVGSMDDLSFEKDSLDLIWSEGAIYNIGFERGLSQGDHLFLVEKFIEYTNDDGFVDRESFKITDDAKKLLFSELNLSSMRGVRPKGGMLSFEDIKPKQLFYNSKERKQVDELATLLEEEHYQSIRNRLRETNFR
jgi:SAM-dependent methyltransferase